MDFEKEYGERMRTVIEIASRALAMFEKQELK
jgi:hypothetical protein